MYFNINRAARFNKNNVSAEANTAVLCYKLGLIMEVLEKVHPLKTE